MENEKILKLTEIKNDFIKQENKFDYKDKLLSNDAMENNIESLLINLIKHIFNDKILKTEFIRRISYINDNAKIFEKLSDKQIKIIDGAIYKSDEIEPFLSLQIEPIFESLLKNHKNNRVLKKIIADFKNLFIEDFIDVYCLYCFYARKNHYLNEEHNNYFKKIYNYFVFWHTLANSDSKIYKKNYVFQIQNVIRELEIFIKSNIITPFNKERLEKNNKINSLTHEEKRLFDELIQGKKEKECAKILHKELSTIQTQRKSIYQKLDVSDRSELLAKYLPPFNPMG